MSIFADKTQSNQERDSCNSLKRTEKAPFGQSHPVNPILHLQRTVGNQAVQRILHSGNQVMSEGSRFMARYLAHTIQQRTGSPLLQLEEARPAAAVPALYTQALARLGSIDATLHGYLQRAGWNTYREVHREVSQSVNVIFRLRIRQDSLPRDVIAQFVPGRVDYSDPTNPIYPMTMALSIPSGPTTVDELTRSLYHEGIHMLIYMDRHLTSPPSPHGAAFDRYLQFARSHQNYVQIRDALVRYTQAFPPPGAAPSVSVLEHILDAIVEEKYVRDRAQVQVQAHRLSGQIPTNEEIARGYIYDKLASMNVVIDRTDRDIVDAIRWMTEIFDAIDTQI